MSYKILTIAPTPFFADRGCHVRIYEEIKALQSLGHRITLCTYPIGRDMDGIDIRRIRRIPWYHKLEAGPSWHKFYLDELLYQKIKKILKHESFDLIHAHLHEGVFIAGRLKKRFRLPIVADFQGGMTDEIKSHGFCGNNPWIMKGFLAMERRINRIPDILIMSSKKSAQIFQKDFGIPERKMRVIADGVDTEIFSINHHDKNQMKSELNLPSDRIIIIYLGLLTSYQGIDILIDIIPEVIQKIKNVHFLIMGFPNEERYRKICDERKIASHVTFTGKIPYNEAPKYLACGDIAVSPKKSLTEANGKLMNYMAMGLPSVVFDTEGNREILGAEGIYAAYPDSGDFSRQLISILEDPSRQNQLYTRLREKAVKEFSWKERALSITQIYDEAIKGLRSENVSST
jgi:glycosyltransferase involved in cell wall biosynthesis